MATTRHHGQADRSPGAIYGMRGIPYLAIAVTSIRLGFAHLSAGVRRLRA